VFTYFIGTQTLIQTLDEELAMREVYCVYQIIHVYIRSFLLP